MNRIILLIVVFFIFFIGKLDGNNIVDTEKMQSSDSLQVIKLDSVFFEQYYNDKNFAYENIISSPSKPFKLRFLDWLRSFIKKIDNLIELPFSLFKLLLWVLIAALIFWGIKLLKFNKLIDNHNDREIVVNINEIEEEVQDYEQAIKLCLDNADYRKAIRFQYLNLLFELNKAEIINISVNNTNNDIQHKVEKKKINPLLFSKIKKAYNAVWYGHYEIDINDYQKITSWYQEFTLLIKNNVTNS